MKALLLLFIVSIFPLLHGQTSKELLRDGLFAEESDGDLKTATEKYEALLKAFEAERKVAATALFRLAAVKRKQGDEKATLALYEEFGEKFGDIEPQATMVRENYLAVSGKALSNGVAGVTEEDKELERVKRLKITSPDLFPNLNEFTSYVSKGWTKVIVYLLQEGADPGYKGALGRAVAMGNLAMVEALLSGKKKPGQVWMSQALETAVLNERWSIAEKLFASGASLKESNPGILANSMCYQFEASEIERIVKYGADINHPVTTPLHLASFQSEIAVQETNGRRHPSNTGNFEPYVYTKALLGAGADVEAATTLEGVRAIHCAAITGDNTHIQILLDAGADINALTHTPPEEGLVVYDFLLLEFYAHAPIDLAPLETVPFLLKAGAKVTSHVLGKAFDHEDFDLIPSLVEAGVDLNKKLANGRLPLNQALRFRRPELVKLFLENGADFEQAEWSALTSELRIKYAQKYLYPALRDSEVLSVALPEIRSEKFIIQKVELQPNVQKALLEVGLPWRFSFNGGDYKIEVDRLTWKLYRGEEVANVDLTELPFPNFEKGDILEITGLSGQIDYHSSGDQLGEKLRDHRGSKIPVNLLRASRFPFQVTLEGETWDLTMCPDRWFYDARTKEIPEAKLGTVLNLLERNTIDPVRRFPRAIVVHRQGVPDLRFLEKEGAMDQFEIKRGDHIEVFEIKDSPEEEALASETQSIKAMVPGVPGGWIWEVGNHPPDLLALLTDINIGLPEESLILSDGISAASLDENSFQKILPGIDLSKILVHRTSDGLVSEIQVNLEEKIQAWNEAGRVTEPVGFQLKAGDKLTLTTEKEGEPGFSELAHLFLQAALNFTVIYDGESYDPQAWTLKYHQAKWVSLPRGLFPILVPGTLPSVRGDRLFQAYYSVSLRRDDETELLKSLKIYWPKQGDYLSETQSAHLGGNRPPIPGGRGRGRVNLLLTPNPASDRNTNSRGSNQNSYKSWPLPEGESLEEPASRQNPPVRNTARTSSAPRPGTTKKTFPNVPRPSSTSTPPKRSRYVTPRK